MKKSINELILYGEENLKNITDTYLLDSKLLLCKILNKDNLYLFMNKDELLSEDIIELFESYIARRKTGEPLQYITNHQEFMGLDFYVKKGVLIPRSDTEILVEILINKLKKYNDLRILDIGTGSGAIHIALAHFLKDAKLTTVDISSDAIEIAKENAKSNNVYSRIEYYESDLFSKLDKNNKFDVIVSNPPYIPTDVIDTLQDEVSMYEPKIALDGGIDGLDFYRKIIKSAKEYLIGLKLVAFEVGHDQAEIIKDIFLENEYKNIEIYKDLNGIKRVVIAQYER